MRWRIALDEIASRRARWRRTIRHDAQSVSLKCANHPAIKAEPGNWSGKRNPLSWPRVQLDMRGVFWIPSQWCQTGLLAGAHCPVAGDQACAAQDLSPGASGAHGSNRPGDSRYRIAWV
jgi:hypothetical protein